ncbi:hypothetical protein CI105_02360 [Candidatus Izimaplasma bacterium ZiA1]|uniref:FAD-dependent oxidoreductase n=1 Tax=Candidatus Izimoplasma sp. ZiA1 TaxID=2024899 RepID=UPI000BAA55CD|nr:hypothetical protein CI105_02360 [Candidatus Izimaplasma bacterium ZiA1]
MSSGFKSFELEFVNAKSLNEYYIFSFKKPKGLVYKEGQYGIFKHISKKVIGSNSRAFSFVSTVDDKDFRIATRIIDNPSDFKKQLKNLKINEKITVEGPYGDFILDGTKHAVFIAGGIGITPIISILNSLKSHSFNNDLSLIYSEANKDYPFGDELKLVNNLKIDFVSGIADTVFSIEKNIKKYNNSAVYYMAGSPGFITGLNELLIKNGIKSENIIYDEFFGY